MQPSPRVPRALPLATPLLLALFVVLALVVALIEVGVLEYAYARIGIGHRFFAGLLLASLLGSLVNLPVGQLRPGPLVAVNLGGAVVPALLSLHLVALHDLWVSAALASGAVAVVTHILARPVAGVGIAVPVLAPPLLAAAAGLATGGQAAPALAYVAGTLGTLIGADLTNLGRMRELGAPVVSIGGAGTFDGVFLAGVIAVLLA